LRAFRFTGYLFAIPEGTPIFAGEPFLTIRAPLMEAQIPETYLLATIGFQSLIATKAAQSTSAPRASSDFSARIAPSPPALAMFGCSLGPRVCRNPGDRARRQTCSRLPATPSPLWPAPTHREGLDWCHIPAQPIGGRSSPTRHSPISRWEAGTLPPRSGWSASNAS